MKFNPEISLGAIVEILMLLIVVAGGFMKLGRLEAKLNIMFDWFQSSVIHRSERAEDDESRRQFHQGDQ